MKFSYIFAKKLFVGRKKLLLSYQSLCFHSIPRDWWQSKQKQNWNSDGFCAISLLRGSLLSEMCSFVPTAHFWHIYFIIKSTKTNPGICLAITFISIFIRVAQFNEIVDKKIQMCSPRDFHPSHFYRLRCRSIFFLHPNMFRISVLDNWSTNCILYCNRQGMHQDQDGIYFSFRKYFEKLEIWN